MLQIKRRNILGLIGKHRGKYHSCILSCYAFDFFFFEQSVLPKLRLANVKNVSVLADGNFLEVAQESTTGYEFKYNKTYSFQPIYTRGVFHPKIMLLTGIKHGLLLIGSGNITSSGLSTNDEIWGAFHLNSIENDNGPLFAEAWHYLQQFISEPYGFLPQKIEWVRKYSPWLAQLPRGKGGFKLESLQQEIMFIHNSKDISIYQQIITNIPRENLQSLTVISPYYDQNGELLEALSHHYSPENFNCIIDKDYGIIPQVIGEGLSKSIQFFEWKDCKKDYDEQYNRLHAKLFHFDYPDGLEFIVLGSANATIAAMGSQSKTAINHEAGIIISRKTTSSWLKELGIYLPDTPLELSTINNTVRLKPINKPRQTIKVRVLYSELRGDTLTLYANKEASFPSGKLQIVSRISSVVEQISFSTERNKLSAQCSSPEEVFKVCLLDDEGDRISNYSIVHRFEALIKCNPDPQQEKLHEIFEQDFSDGTGLTVLLGFMDYAWADDEFKVKGATATGGDITNKTTKEISDKIYETLIASEFNMVRPEVLMKQRGELSSTSVQIVDFLNLVLSDSSFKTEENFEESQEQKLLEDLEQKGEGNEVSSSVQIKTNAKKEQVAISKFFKELDGLYNKKLKSLYKDKAMTNTPNEKINIRNLSNILIGLQLIQIYHGRNHTIEVDIEGSEEKRWREERYIIEGSFSNKNDTIKGFLMNVWGRFLLLATAGMKSYEYEVVSQKMNFFKKQALINSLFVTLNLSWGISESDYMENIILNSLFYLNNHPKGDSYAGQELLNGIDQKKIKAKYISRSFKKNYETFSESILPGFISWYEIFQNKQSRSNLIVDNTRIVSGSIIFNTRIGFNIVKKINSNSGKFSLSLSRPGYKWLERQKSCLWERITYPSKCIAYKI